MHRAVACPSRCDMAPDASAPAGAGDADLNGSVRVKNAITAIVRPRCSTLAETVEWV
jgi:hypothetical protein